MKTKLFILAILLLAISAFFALNLDRYLSLVWLKSSHDELVTALGQRPVLVVSGFMVLQASAMALSIPGSVLTLALAAGAIFGFQWGVPIVLVAVVFGDSLGFLAARYLFREWVEKQLATQVKKMQRGIERDGPYYLFAMRLAAVIPFFIVNWTMALTHMPLRTFAPVSFLGLAPVTAIYVNAGTQLASIKSSDDIISLPLLASLGLLGIAPVALRYLMTQLRPNMAS